MSEQEFSTKMYKDYQKIKIGFMSITGLLLVMVITLALGWVVRIEQHEILHKQHAERFNTIEYRQEIIRYNYIDRQTIELLVASFDAYTKEIIALSNGEDEDVKEARERYNELWKRMLNTTSYQTRGGS